IWSTPLTDRLLSTHCTPQAPLPTPPGRGSTSQSIARVHPYWQDDTRIKKRFARPSLSTIPVHNPRDNPEVSLLSPCHVMKRGSLVMRLSFGKVSAFFRGV